MAGYVNLIAAHTWVVIDDDGRIQNCSFVLLCEANVTIISLAYMNECCPENLKKTEHLKQTLMAGTFFCNGTQCGSVVLVDIPEGRHASIFMVKSEDSFTLKMEVARSTNTSVGVSCTTRRHMPDDNYFQREILRSHT